MKGLRLHVRTTTAADDAALGELLRDSGTAPTGDSASIGFIARLLGDPVACAGAVRDGDTLRIESIFVAPSLRRKRVGTILLSEIRTWALAHGVSRLTLAANAAPQQLATRAGFIRDGDSFVRSIRA